MSLFLKEKERRNTHRSLGCLEGCEKTIILLYESSIRDKDKIWVNAKNLGATFLKENVRLPKKCSCRVETLFLVFKSRWRVSVFGWHSKHDLYLNKIYLWSVSELEKQVKKNDPDPKDRTNYKTRPFTETRTQLLFLISMKHGMV